MIFLHYLKVKKALIFLIIAVIFVFVATLGGCSTNNSPDNIEMKKIGEVESIELGETEKTLLKGVGVSRYFVFDYKIENEKKVKVDFWVEFYANGKHKGNSLEMGTVLDENDAGQLMIANTNIERNEELWRLSVISESGSASSLSNDITFPKDLSGTTWDKGLKGQEIYLEKPITLAVIIGDNGDSNSLMGVPLGIYENDLEAMKELMKNDYVYIYKIKFSNLD